MAQKIPKHDHIYPPPVLHFGTVIYYVKCYVCGKTIKVKTIEVELKSRQRKRP